MKKMLVGSFAAILVFGMASAAQATVIDFYSIADAEITGRATGQFVNTHNWGDLLYLTGNINRTGGPTSAEFPNFGDSRGLFQFDLSLIPTGSTINSATVSIYVAFNAFSPVSSRITSVSLYQVTSTWTETGVTYDTRPSWNTTQVTSMSIPAGTGSGGSIPFNGYINGNVTNLVRDWFDGDIVNFGLVTSDTYTTTGLLRIYAREAGGTASDPRLRVDFTPPVAASVPEPSSFILFNLAAVSLVVWRRRKLRG